MKHKIFTATLLSLLALALAVSAPAQSCATGDPITPTRLTFTSLEGNATLCGFSEYTTPANPPKKYRRQTWAGSIQDCRFTAAGCGTPVTNGLVATIAFTGARVFSPETCTLQDLASAPNGQTFKSDCSPVEPTTAGSLPGTPPTSVLSRQGIAHQTSSLTSTQRVYERYPGNSPCFEFFGQYIKSDGVVSVTLSEEDTEDDAEKRAGTTPGTSNTAFRVGRTTGFSFGFRKVHYEADFNVDCAGEYDAVVTYSTTLRVAPFTTGTDTQVVRKILQPGKHTITGDIRVKEKDTNYTVTSIELRKPCGELKEAGMPDFRLESVHVELGLGLGAKQESAGFLSLEAGAITSALYLPAALTVGTADSGVETVRDGVGALRQIKAPQALADIVTLDASSYEVRFYAPADVGAQEPVSKIYAVSGTPFTTFKFENPDTNQTTRLRISETRGSITRVSEYSFNSATNTWALSTGNGLRQESLAVIISGADTTKTSTIRDSSNTVVSKIAKTHRTFAWGEELISEALDPDGAALTTTSDFYSNQATDGGAYRHLKQRINANGSWERHTYDATGRPLKTIRPYLDAPVTASESACRVTEMIYTTLADADGDGLPEQLTTTIETTLGTETGRTHLVEWSKPVVLGAESFARRIDIRCVTPGAAWDAADNLVTETLTYTADPLNGRTRRVVNPDGTATLTAYTIAANGEQTIVIKTGVPNGALDDITDGTRTVTFTSAQGQDTGESATDIAANLTLSSWTATQFDALGRPTRLDHADGTYVTRDYACCGLASERDRSGLVTSYGYDDLGRQTTVTRSGLSTRTAYDAAGRVQSVTRIGTDASEMVRQTNSFDLAGRLTAQRDALNRLTATSDTFDAATGQSTRTTTPPAGTSVEVRHRDGSALSVAGTAAAPRSFEYGLEAGQLFAKEIRVGEGGAVTEWVKTYTDFAGRTFKTVQADGATAQSYFNAAGQMVRQVDPDGIATLFAYNAKGEQDTTAVDMDGNGTIDYAGTDRVTSNLSSVGVRDGRKVLRTETQVWETDGTDTPASVSISEQSADGLRSWQTVRGLTTSVVIAFDGSGGRTVTTTAPDGVKTIQVYTDDQLASATVKTAADAQLAAVVYGFDAHHRQTSVTDARTGTTSFTYFDDDQLHTTTTPDPDPARSGPGYDPQTTTYHYDSAGRVDTVTQPDGGVVNTTYWPTGAIQRTWGSRTYPVEYTYDVQLRVKTQTTWQDFANATGAAVTTWNYNPLRGWLDNKRYADTTGPSYLYKPSGRLSRRTWARGVQTNYTYNAAGDLTGTTYSNGTPAVTIAYDRAGRPKATTDASGTRTLSYHASGQLQDEVYSSGLLNGLSVGRTFDSLSRLSGLSVPSVNSVTYSYDAASRLDTVTQGANTATYGYVPNSPLVGSVTFKQGPDTRLATTKAYDNLNRLSSVSSVPLGSPEPPGGGGSALSAFYQYNSANQRTRATREDNAYWQYEYDSLGQVAVGRKHLPTDAIINGLDFGWSFDDIGNRKTATANSQISNYSANLLNQYSSRTVPGVIDVMGAAQADATVTVMSPATNGTIYPVTRQGELYTRQLTLDNSTAAQYASVKVTGVKNLVGSNGEDAVTEETRNVLVSGTPEVFTHDADGNLTADAKWSYTWDGENRLIAVETNAAAASAGVPKQKLEFAYDGQGRRVAKKVYRWNPSPGSWILDSSLLFVYDGWNLIAELNALSSNAVVRSYVWGLDLSGSLQGAGGVGGLLFAQTLDPGTQTLKPHGAVFDGNGNVIAYVDMASGAKSATYEYGAFGETIIADGPMQDAFPFRFSTKFTDSETGLISFPHRPYDPPSGRWLSRDPAEEEAGGPNLYAMNLNDPVNKIDPLGLWSVDEHYDIITKWLGARGKLPPGSTYTQYRWHCYTINVEKALKDGNDDVDGTGNYTGNFFAAQATQNSYQHAMRAPGQTVASAREQMISFINANKEIARQSAELARSLLANGNPSGAGGETFIVAAMTKAIHHLGRAQHPVADMTSPLHAGFQEWPGLITLNAANHHRKETPGLYGQQGGYPANFVKNVMDGSLDEVLKP